MLTGFWQAAFYNPAQVINRDLSLATIQWYIDEKGSSGGPLSYLEALSATGLRALRVAKETKGLSTIVANDLEARAVEQIRRNVELNGLAEGRDVTVSHADAVDLMHAHRGEAKRFDVVDIDPYGPPTIFLDGAVQCVKVQTWLLCFPPFYSHSLSFQGRRAVAGDGDGSDESVRRVGRGVLPQVRGRAGKEPLLPRNGDSNRAGKCRAAGASARPLH